jgi:Dolichyl-phosphate-mannose-protein mannosyltransferase
MVPERFNRMLLLLYMLLASLVISTIVLCLVPPVSRDALIHHLTIPKLYLQMGEIFEIPSLGFSYYPMNLDLLYMIPLAFNNDIAPKYIHLTFALLTAWLIYTYLKEKLNRTYALLGSIFFLSIPVILKLSITVYVDLGLIFFTTASLLLLFRWIEKKYQMRYLIYSAICCGMAVGTKYNGLISLLLLSFFAPFLYSRSGGTKSSNLTALKYGSIFLLTAITIASPWFLRNYLWTSNPLYPLFESIFNPGSQQTATGGMDIFTLRRHFFNESLAQILLLPIRVFFEGQDHNPQYFDGKLNPFLLFLPFLAFFRQKMKPWVQREKKAMLAFCILFFLFALFQSGMRIRYISPIIPFLVILSMFGLQNITGFAEQNSKVSIKTAGHSLAFFLVISMLVYNGIYLIGQFRYVQPLQYISGTVSRETYIANYYPEYPLIQYINKQPRSTLKTLCLFLGDRGYYMDFPYTFEVPTTRHSPFTRLLAKSSTPETIQTTLLQNQYQQILLRNDLTTSWLNTLGENQRIIVSFFQNNLELMYSRNGYSLFRIKPVTHRHQQITQ